MEAAIEIGIGVGLVARIDDRPLESGLEANLDLEEVGALGDLVVDPVRAVLGPHLPCAGEDLSRGKERGDVLHEVGEGGLAVHEVVLVAAVRVPLAV